MFITCQNNRNERKHNAINELWQSYSLRKINKKRSFSQFPHMRIHTYIEEERARESHPSSSDSTYLQVWIVKVLFETLDRDIDFRFKRVNL